MTSLDDAVALRLPRRLGGIRSRDGEQRRTVVLVAPTRVYSNG
ncbi:hypothetical protein [Mycolicibacterium novocastrense]|nr:hypothetical protein [Mycolicibacterium novocastrense]